MIHDACKSCETSLASAVTFQATFKPSFSITVVPTGLYSHAYWLDEGQEMYIISPQKKRRFRQWEKKIVGGGGTGKKGYFRRCVLSSRK